MVNRITTFGLGKTWMELARLPPVVAIWCKNAKLLAHEMSRGASCGFSAF